MYGHSALRGNERGLKGEAATALWLDAQGYRFKPTPRPAEQTSVWDTPDRHG